MNSGRLRKIRADPGLAHLLELHGSIESPMESGYWTKIEARRVKATSTRPFGLKYSLTLHSPTGRRLIGFDNAHPIKSAMRAGGRPAWDHHHLPGCAEPVPYEYRGAYQLLDDLYDEVIRVLKEGYDEQNH